MDDLKEKLLRSNTEKASTEKMKSLPTLPMPKLSYVKKARIMYERKTRQMLLPPQHVAAEPSHKEEKLLIEPLVFFWTYVLVGSAFYYFEEDWNIHDSIYFAMVTMSTVGYGDLYPTTPLSQIFTMIYILAGVVAVFPKLSQVVNYFATPVTRQLRQLIEATFPTITSEPTKFVSPAVAFYCKNLVPVVTVFFLIQIAFAIAFKTLEDWDFMYAFWHCYVTATTVGYGDTVPTSQPSRVLATVHILISVCLLGVILNEIHELQTEREGLLRREEQLRRRLDPRLIAELDRDGNGVDKLEFVFGMLTSLKILQWSDVSPFIEQFEKLDADNSGILTTEDLQAMQQSWDDGPPFKSAKSMKLARLFKASKQMDTLKNVLQVAGGLSCGDESPSSAETARTSPSGRRGGVFHKKVGPKLRMGGSMKRFLDGRERRASKGSV